MALYHVNIGHVSRSTGRSVVQSAAYITGSSLHETRRDLTANYSNRASDVIWSETLAPSWALDSFKELSIWDTVESFEDEYAVKRYPNDLVAREKYLNSARTAMTIVVALPRELSSDVSIELVKEFVNDHYISQGLFATCSMHGDEGNPHAHIQLSRRSIEQDGTLSWAKNRTMCLKKELFVTRKLWADMTNSYLEREGFDVRITEKSFADLGVKLIPTQHRGWFVDKLSAMGVQSRIIFENDQAFEDNKNKLLEDPEIILTDITSKQATFTQIQLLGAIRKRLGDDDSSIAQVFETALDKAIVLGTGIGGSLRYTSEHYQSLEAKALQSLSRILKPEQNVLNTYEITPVRSDEYLSRAFGHMSDEQLKATHGLIQGGRFAVLVGRAGTGKTTTTIKAACELYQQAGFNVIGTSLSALASANLGVEAGIKSRTIASWLSCWDRYVEAENNFLSFNSIVTEGVLKQFKWFQDLNRFQHLKLTNKSVLIVDEAGMIGTRQWNELLNHANHVGAKVIAVGDDHQYKAIEAGDFFRELIDRAEEKECLFSLKTIRRQRSEWMKEASHHLAELNTAEALSTYEKQGHVHEIDTSSNVINAIAEAYLTKLKEEHKDGLILAFTNDQTNLLNCEIRQRLRTTSIPGHTLSDVDVLNVKGYEKNKSKGFALGDKIVFLQNEKKKITLANENGQIVQNRFITNGTTGILERVTHNGKHIVVRLDQNTTAHFNINDYNHISHGYALTSHKSQGQTVDFTLVAASKAMDAKGLYVAMTRHRDDVQLFYAKEEFESYKKFALHMSRFDNKDLVKDYTIHPDNCEAWARVQEYQHCIYDAAALHLEASQEGDSDWAAYKHVKMGHIALGKEILNDFDSHKLYLHQAGLTEENLMITTARKARPLCRAEEKAKIRVELYGEAAQLSRELWHDVRKVTPSANHPLFSSFQEARLERDTLAIEILANYPLHREFVSLYSRKYSINKQTLENQVAYREKSVLLKQTEHSKEITAQTRRVMHDIQQAFAELTPDRAHTPKHASEKKFERTSAEIITDLNDQIKDLALHFFDKPKRNGALQWRYGTNGSISIHIGGAKKGMYANFESGVSGNAVTLIADQLGLDKKEAFKWGVKWLGYERSVDVATSLIKHDQFLQKTYQQNEIDADNWTPIFPVQERVPDLKSTPHLRYMLKGRTEVARYPYKDADGNTLGLVIRLEDKIGKKITPTLTYCRYKNDDATYTQNNKNSVLQNITPQWRWKGFGDDRPIYGLEQLKQIPHAPVLIVEGEKTCEAARKLFPDHAVITWSGGCGAVNKSDWSVLKGRDVTIFPDHDKAGFNAALKIGYILKEHGHKNIQIVDLPSTLPHKWDLADPLPDEIVIETLLHTTVQHEEVKEHLKPSSTPYCINYEEIAHQANVEDLSSFVEAERMPLIVHIANKTYRELNELNAFGEKTTDNEHVKRQAILTGIYTSLAKGMLEDEYRNDTRFVEKANLMGALIAREKIEHPEKKESSRIYQSKDKMQALEKDVQNQIKNPAESTINLSPIACKEILHTHHHYQALSQQGMPHKIIKECLDALHQTYSTQPEKHAEQHTQPEPQVVRAVIQHMITQKSRGAKEIKPITHEEAQIIHAHNEGHIQKVMQKTQEHMKYIGHQQALQQHSREVEL